MAGNLIEQVKEIEAEADGIVAQARAKARQIEQAAEDDARNLRAEYEESFGQAMEEFKAGEGKRATEEEASLDRKAAAIADRLKSVDVEAASDAVELILKHLRGG